MTDNPENSSRWYPGGGIYRNVWLTKVNHVHIAQWGRFIRQEMFQAPQLLLILIYMCKTNRLIINYYR